MSRIKYIIILGLFSFFLNAQSTAVKVDAILAGPRDTHQLGILIELLADMINAGDIIPDTVFDQSQDMACELEDFWSLAAIYSDRSIYDLNTGQIEKGLVHVDEAIEYAEISEKNYLIPDCYATKIHLLMIDGQTKEAAELASGLAKTYRAEGDLYNEAIIYQLLSSISSGLRDHELTRLYDSTAVELARQSGYVDVLLSVLSTRAENLNLLGYPEEALEQSEEALAMATEHEMEFEIGNALSARAVANTTLGNYATALEDFEKLTEWYGDQKFAWVMISEGILLQRIGRHDDARELLLEAKTLIKETSNDHLALKRCYLALQTVGLSAAEYDTVVMYTRLAEIEQDSLQIAENMKNLLELEKRYKTEEKTAEISKQQAELARQQTQLYVTIGGLLVALLVGAGFILFSWNLRKRNAENQQLIKEKEILIGEIHHRVKNNLQVISSLLQLQRRGLETNDEKGREALKESQNRVNSMGLIHRKLYQGTEVTSVDMAAYLKDLGETLLDAYQLEDQVDIFYDVTEIKLDVDVAIPLGLIVNELVTNSLKYAFPNGREGLIGISLHPEKKQLRLTVNDDGVGAAAAATRSDGTSFGNNLIELLTEKLKGRLTKLSGRGYGVEILFPG
ncbi:hypothetical protein FUA23_19460 [Neolewinella aurantiaca]|uniref:histidine kinase n=1 Tax=Neolewinella aurantiaca TaxID=2602767 RepID=A0A5C7FJI7_9BACT|nr:histidine kinase dimerization/phosphoacceptor domain -containing protein [Neolewinella aurantiaca]TXF86299.1 hypothetical protein FUA23_19460 [Neolewinella aurantiaca]